MEIYIQHFFDAAHQLPNSDDLVSKGCATLHGHTYKVIVRGKGNKLHTGMLIDFKAVKQVIDKLDHTTILMKGNAHINACHQEFVSGVAINDVVVFEEPPTSENIAKHIYNELLPIFAARNISRLEVAVCEGYKGEDRANWTTFEGDFPSYGGGITSMSIGAAITTAGTAKQPPSSPHKH